jgi:hypothetical protein
METRIKVVPRRYCNGNATYALYYTQRKVLFFWIPINFDDKYQFSLENAKSQIDNYLKPLPPVEYIKYP